MNRRFIMMVVVDMQAMVSLRGALQAMQQSQELAAALLAILHAAGSNDVLGAVVVLLANLLPNRQTPGATAPDGAGSPLRSMLAQVRT